MRIARRGPLTFLLLIGALAFGIGWLRMGGAAPDDGPRYVEATLGRPVRVNPLTADSVEAEGDIEALVFAGLMRLRADGMPEPELAERWEVTPDGLTYTFHLREGVTWHDGAAFDADDVAFTIARIQSEGFDGAPGLAAQWAGAQVFVADSLTVLVRLPEPAADFLQRATLGILPAHLDDRMTPGAGFETPPFDRDPVGAGPYRLASLQDDRALLERNTSYVLGSPAVDRIELRFASGPADQLEMVREGEVDAALLAEDTDQATLSELADGGHALRPLQRNAYTILYINNAAEPLRQPALRRALAASVDVAALARDAGLTGVPASGVIPQGSWAYEPPQEARPSLEVLWAAAQWPRGSDGLREREGVTLTLELVTNGEPPRIALAEAVAAQLAEQGVTVEVVPVPAQRVVTEYLRPGAYDLALFGWENPPDPDPYAGWHTSQLGAGNVASFSDAQADVLLEEARTTLDVMRRRELFSLFLARFEELGASVVIEYPQRVYVQPAGLTGFTPLLLTSPAARFADVHLWRLP